MKRMKKNVLFSLLLLTGAGAFSQNLKTPSVSPPARLDQQIGLTNTTLIYSRPGVKGRKVFGELVPFGQVWRSGANEATKIRFDRPVFIDINKLDPGAYGIYSIPGAAEWTWIISRDTALWGDRGYNPDHDLLRFKVKPESLGERVETLEFRWMNIATERAELVLEWEYTRVRLPVRFYTQDQMALLIESHLGDQAKGQDYYQAARYYLDNGLDGMQALRWINKAIEMNGEQAGMLRYKGLLELSLKDTASAVVSLNKSLDLARQIPNADYIRMNEFSLQSLSRTPAPLPAQEILARSIAWHDPGHKWETGSLSLSLYESRPGNGYRLSDILIDNEHGVFEMTRRQEKELIYRRSSPEGCEVMVNGAEKFFPQAEDIQSLRCKDNARYSNYYSYLWGLPMKLKDPGAIVAPTAYVRDFYGRQLYEVHVTYAEGVGSDSWYFYFDPVNFALSGYRFYHNESAGDGEYILLEGETEVDGFRIPSKRHWYTHQGRAYLGTDEVILKN